MELMFPVAIFVGVPIAIILTFITLKGKDVYQKGTKVANTNFLEDTPLYKKLQTEYKIFRIVALVCLWLSLVLAIIMLSRPVKVDVVNRKLHNRDIIICMDISDSVDELNLKICGELKEIVKDLNGERFGITIFNARSVLLVPLTSDYDYVMDTLNTLEDAFEYSISNDDFFSMENSDLYYYKYEGTLSEFGSSYIGDGLASALYNFPDLKENDERSRIIIFTTDNELNGTPFVTVEEAAELCRMNDVKVFAVTPENIIEEASFRNAMNSTGGGHYEATSAQIFDDLKDDIRLTATSAMDDIKITVTDKPEILFICLLVFITMYFIFSRKVKL